MVEAYALVGAQWGLMAAQWAGIPLAPEPPFHARYVFCLNWSHRIGEGWLRRSEFVNFHCTDLARAFGRGGHPVENLLLRGFTETVVTAHRMTAELDAGPVYGTRGPISLAGTKEDIQIRFVEPVAKLMRWIIDTNPEPKPQVGEPTYFKRLSPDAYREFWANRG